MGEKRSVYYALVLLLLIVPVVKLADGKNQISTTITSPTQIGNPIPDLIFYNGTIITMEPDPMLIQSKIEAVSILNDKIFELGTEQDILVTAMPITTLINLGNKTLLPGFIDSHSHWIGDRNEVNIATIENAVDFALSNGWTSISELFVNQQRLDELLNYDQDGELRIRVNAYMPLSWQFQRFGNWYQAYTPGHEYSPTLRIGGVKIFMDSWYGPGSLHYFDNNELENLVKEAHDLGYQVAVHSVVDNATDIVLDAFENALDGKSNEVHRHRIEHVVLLRDDQIQRMAAFGIIASFQLTWFNADYVDSITNKLGLDKVDLLARWRDLLDAGVPSLGSTDFPWSATSVNSSIQSIYQAVTRIGDQGLLPPTWLADQLLTVEQALRLITIDAAYGTFQENVKGSIKEGKFADFVVLSDNPLTVAPSDMLSIDVIMTMVGGVVEYCATGYQVFCAGMAYTPTSQTVTSPNTRINLSGMLIFYTIVFMAMVRYRQRQRK